MKYYNDFSKNLFNLLSDINRYSASNKTKTLLEQFTKLNIEKIMKNYITSIKKKDCFENEAIFCKALFILTDIDMKFLWYESKENQKKKIWTYLKILYIQAELALNTEKKQQSNEKNNDENTELINFNPYTGVGETNRNYSIDEMFSGPESLPNDSSQNTTSPLGGMFNLGKMLNLDELGDKLKGLDKEQITMATNDIKKLLGTNMDEKTNNLISDMLSNITTELGKEDISTGNPLTNIMKIAENVANKMKPQMASEEIDFHGLLNSTQSLVNNNSGSNNQINPFAMLNNMLESNKQNFDNHNNKK